MRKRVLGGVLGASALLSGALVAGPWMVAAQAAPVSPAAAVTEHVACNDVTTLNNDIAAANVSGNPTTIVLASGCTYVLTTSVAGVVGGPVGPVGLMPVTGTVTLVGHVTTIERSATAAGPFRIAEVSGFGASLTIEGITLKNGVAGGGPRILGASSYGGCLLIGGSEPSAPTVHGSGSIFGSLVLKDSKVENCRASQGAGIYLDLGTSGYLYKTDVLHNTATSDGGGISAQTGTGLRVVASYLAGNTSGNNGGGIYFDGNRLTVTGSELSQNYATSGGGGVYADAPSTALQGSTLLYNASGGNGGGVYAAGGSTSVEFSILEVNDARGNGGGIFVGGGSVFSLNSYFVRNLPNNCAPGGAVRGCYL